MGASAGAASFSGRGPVKTNLVIEGDSLEVTTETRTAWSDLADWTGYNVTTVNVATGGERMVTSIQAQGATQVDPAYDETAECNIALLGNAGTNDVQAGGGTVYTAEQIYDAKKNWGIGRRASGFYVIMFTIQRGGYGPLAEPMRVATNELLLANAVADGAADLVLNVSTTDVISGSAGSAPNWLPDHDHLSTAGHTMLLAYVQPFIKDAIALFE